VLVGIGERTHARLPDWSSTQKLFEADLARDPSYREAYFVLGDEAFRAGRFAEASQRIAPLLAMDARFEGTTGYLNWLSVAELACLASLGRQDFAGILALETRWQREFPALAQAPTFRLCAGQARDGLGRTEEALAVYVGVANELGASAPPPLFLAIARDLAVLGRREEALRWLARARAGADAALLVQVQGLATALGQSR
jgi:tetratricopeptide (TPR) repeat protein